MDLKRDENCLRGSPFQNPLRPKARYNRLPSVLLALCLAAVPVTKCAAALTDGLVGYWPFDEGRGTNALDVSGRHADGALLRFPADGSAWIKGQIGGALRFTSTNAVVIDRYPAPNSTMTFSAWVWTDSAGGGTIGSSWYDFAGVYTLGYHIYTWPGLGMLISEPTPYGAVVHGGQGGTFTSFQSWHHVGFVADGSQVWMWIDGQITGQFGYAGKLVYPPPTPQLLIGPGWKGKIDEVAIWDRALSDDEVMELYETGLAGKPLFSPPRDVVAWGDDSAGQTEVPEGLTNVVAIAGGAVQSLALKRDGTITAWGRPAVLIPVPAGLTDVVAIGTGSLTPQNISLALRRDRTMAVWGSWDPLGAPVPNPLFPPPEFTTNVLAASVWDISYLLIRPDGTLDGWPYAPPLMITNVAMVASRSFQALALTHAGTVVSWSGEVNAVPTGLTNVVGIAVGDFHNLALKADGTVVAWGDNSHGQTSVPAGLTDVRAIGAGGYHSLALKNDGAVVAWGDNSHGQTNIPAGLSNIVAVAGGEYYSLALAGSGPPLLSKQPIERSSYTGFPFLMLANAVGLPPLAYQWQLKGTNLPGATNAFLLLPSLRADQSGAYVVVVSNALGTVTASNTLLTAIHTRPILTMQPTNQSTYPGGNVSFKVVAEGTAPLTYQWLFNGAPIPGATTPTLSLRAVRPEQAGQYAVVVQNPVGNVSSSSLSLSVGPIIAWGNNFEGETNVPPGLSNIAAVATGSQHCLALRGDGSVVGWGDNSRGQTKIPPGLTKVTAIAAGLGHNLALKADGQVVAWGDDQLGQTDVPARLPVVMAVAAGGKHSLALTADGFVVGWGDNSHGQTNTPPGLSNVVAIAAGGAHNLALKASGRVVAWGDNGYGQASVPQALNNVMAIAAGPYHSLALRADGTVAAWGSNSLGAVQVPPGLSNVVAISAGADFDLALQADGTVVGWGLNNQGQSSVPPGLTDVIQISAGSAFALVLTGNGTLAPAGNVVPRAAYTGSSAVLNAGMVGAPPLEYQWRLNGADLPGATNGWLVLANVQIGDSGKYSVVASNPLGELEREVTLSVVESAPLFLVQPQHQGTYPGGSATFQVSMEGSEPLFYQWYKDGAQIPGANTNRLTLGNIQLAQQGQYSVLVLNPIGATQSSAGRLSIEPVVAWGIYRVTDPEAFPVPVIVPPDLTNAVAVAGGYDHSLALTDEGRVIAWAAGIYDGTNLAVPAGLSNVVAIAGGGFANLAVKSDGTVVGWGDNRGGQTQVPPNLTNAVAVAAGYQNTGLALKADGTGVSWATGVRLPDLHGVVRIASSGKQNLAILDDGALVAWPMIVGAIPHDLTNIIDIAAGQDFSLALRADGTVTSWGSYVGTNVPPNLRDVVAIAAGDYSGYALRTDGTVVAWGEGTTLPGLTNVLDIAAGPTHVLALVGNGKLVRVSDLHLARLRWVSKGDAPWRPQQEVTYDGTETLQSGAIGENQQSRLQTSLFGPGTLTFWWKVSSEAGHDFLQFSLDGAVQDRLSGESDWQQRLFVLGAGFHRLEWRYARDSAGIAGQDAGWLGHLRFSPQGSVQPRITREPISQPILLGSHAVLQVDSLGVEPLFYQWQFNGANITGATNVALTVPDFQLGDTGNYSVIASNAYGQAVSSQANLSLVQVLGWGANNYGQAQPFVAGTQIVAIASGSTFNLALASDGTVTPWGSDSAGVTNVPVFAPGSVVAIAAGHYHALALRDDGTVVSWGNNFAGQTNVPSGLTSVVAIAGGRGFSLALKRDGTVVAWGDPAENAIVVPADLANVRAIAAGNFHALALRQDGTVVGWGLNGTHQTDVPPTLTNAVAIAAGYSHSLALRGDGTVTGWGGNAQGQLQIPQGLNHVVAIAARENHSLALLDDGTVIAWGDNLYGQSTPPPTVAHVVAIAAGSLHSLALEAAVPAPPPFAPPAWLEMPRLDGSQFSVQAPSFIGRIMGLEFTDSLSQPNWVLLPLVLGDGTVKALVDPNARDSTRYYRVHYY